MICPHEYTPALVPDYERCIRCGTYHSTAAMPPETLYNADYWANQRSSLWEQVWNVDMHAENGLSKNHFVLDRIEAERGSALEIGCAPGRLLFWLKHAARFGEVIGIDAKEMHDTIRKIGHFDGELLDGLFPQAGSALRWGAFDYIVALDVFEHSPEPMGFLWECHQLLRPGGQLFLMMPFADEMPADSRFFNAAEHVYLHSASNLRKMAEGTGFIGVHFDCWTQGHSTVSARKPR